MRKILMMGKAGISKMKSQAVILVILLTISATMLNLGLMLALTFSGYMNDIAIELNTSDAFYTLPYAHLTDDVKNRIENHEQIASLDIYDGVMLPSRIPAMVDGEVIMIFRNKDIIPSVSGWLQIGDVLEDAVNPIFVPHVFSADVFGYTLGDSIEFIVDGESLVFTVAGFTGDVFGYGNMAKVYVSEQAYNELVLRYEQYHTALLFAAIYGDEIDVNIFMRDIFTEGITETDSRVLYFGLDRDLRIIVRGSFANFLSLMVITFAAIIIAVCTIIIRFSINNNIERDFSQLGSLKAAGYTSLQIRAGLLVQYLILAITGSILAMPLVHLILPFISGIMAQQTGLFWRPDSNVAVILLTFGIIILVVASFALYCSRRMKTIDPVAAIRGEASGHSFKRNYLPLDKTILPLNIAIGGKLSLQSVGQSIALFLIFTAIAFTAGFSVSMRHTVTQQIDEVGLAMGTEISDVIIEIAPSADSYHIRDEVAAMPGVEQAVFLDYGFVNVNNNYIPIFVMDDFAAKEYPSVFKGRYPVHINEVAISWQAADLWNLDVDDILHIGSQNTMFVVTGITQGNGATAAIDGNGPNISITTQGTRTVLPDFNQNRLYVYLSQEIDAPNFISKVLSIFDEHILNAQDWRSSATMARVMFLDILTLVTTVILIFVSSVILLALYFITVAVIIRRHRFLGIQKAMGCTTFDLMRQISVSFMFPLILGLISGTVIAAFTSNSIAAILMGIKQANFDVPFTWMALAGIALAVFSYATILIITGRVRKISAYDLVR